MSNRRGPIERQRKQARIDYWLAVAISLAAGILCGCILIAAILLLYNHFA